MRPIAAPISDRSRELYGEYLPRYKTLPSMRPFDAPISDRGRELFGEYQKRYETQPSMSAFDALISDRRRELYGVYRSRWSSRKVGYRTSSIDDANGTTWVDATLLGSVMSPQIFDESIYRIYTLEAGGWAGVLLYRILIDGVKVYPFEAERISSGGWESLGTLSTAIRTGETCTVQFKSTNAADTGPAQTGMIGLDLAMFK